MKNSARSFDFSSFARLLPGLAAGLLISSCVTKPPPPPEPPVDPNKPKPLYEWNGTGKTASHVTIDIDEQKVSVFSGDEQIGWATVATGLTSYPTPVGDFKVIEKVVNKKSNLFGKAYNSAGKLVNSDAKVGRDSIPEGGRFDGASMPYYMRLTGDGVGMHAGPIPHPGRRASHGCIRMPRSFAPLVFASIPVGTPVSISGTGPSYSSYLSKQQASAARAYAARKKKAEAAAAPAATGEPSAQPVGTAPSADAKPSDAPPASERIKLPAGSGGATSAPTPAPGGESKFEVRPAVPASGQ